MKLKLRLDAARTAWEEAPHESLSHDKDASQVGTIPIDEALARLMRGWEHIGIPIETHVHACAENPAVANAEVRFLPEQDSPDEGCLDVHLTWASGARSVSVQQVQWAERIVESFAHMLQAGATGGNDEATGGCRRMVRFVVGHGLREKRGLCATAIDVALEEPLSVLVDGVLGDVAYAIFREHGGSNNRSIAVGCASARWTHLQAQGEPNAPELGSLVTALAHWWATVQPSEVVSLCRELEELLYRRVEDAVRSGVAETGLAEAEIFAQTLEVALAGLWQIRPLLGDAEEAEAELEGWQREIEVAIRRRIGIGSSAFESMHIEAPRLPTVAVPNGVDWNGVYVPASKSVVCARSGAPHLAHSNVSGWGSGLPAVPIDFFDGERSLAEIALRICVEAPMPWERACKLAKAWVRRGFVQLSGAPDYTLPEPESLKEFKEVTNYFELPDSLEADRSDTILYFSYGSCMCRYSFRGTVPRYEMIGAARLSGYRLAYTLASIRRGGGAADVVEDPDREVWGVLYRIPRKYLYHLDTREGVFHGRYERRWVRLEALGTVFEPVLTYSVINKAEEEIPPSDEYAGLIWDGAYGILPGEYCRRILDQFDGFGVEPASPL